MKRSETFRLRLTADEHAALQTLSARTGICRSRLARKAIRELVTGNVDLLQREQIAALEVARQLRHIGVNLNQIARHLNAEGRVGKSLSAEVAALRTAVEDSEYGWRGLVAAARARSVPEYGRE
ncbi:MAG: hypothetical protein NVS9B10_26310 [Nevskia sp.]